MNYGNLYGLPAIMALERRKSIVNFIKYKLGLISDKDISKKLERTVIDPNSNFSSNIDEAEN